MIATAALLAFVVMAAAAGHEVLTRAGWVRQFPAAGIVAWQALTITVVVALTLCGLTLTLPLLPDDRVAGAMRLTPVELAHHYPNPGGAIVAALAATLVIVALLKVLQSTATTLLRAFRERRTLRAWVELVGAEHPDGYVTLPHALPMVSCLPGRTPRILVTTGAAAMLTTRQLDLVLAHERLHLRARHHLALAFADALGRTLAWWPFFAAAPGEIRALAEMQADDIAQDPADRRELATALTILGSGGASAAVPAGSQVTARLGRLTRTPGTHRRAHLVVASVAGAVLLATPIALALVPAFTAVTTQCCTYAGETDLDLLPPTDPAP